MYCVTSSFCREITTDGAEKIAVAHPTSLNQMTVLKDERESTLRSCVDAEPPIHKTPSLLILYCSGNGAMTVDRSASIVLCMEVPKVDYVM